MPSVARAGAWLAKPTTTPAVMERVLFALLPAVGVSAWVFGPWVLAHCAATLAAGGVFEALCQWARRRWPAPAASLSGQETPRRPFADRSVPVTCLLIALGLPPSAPLWIGVVAAGVGVVLAKELYGGLGRNVFNPAMAGYAAVLAAYPQALTYTHAETGATALDALRFRGAVTTGETMAGPAFGLLGGAGFEWVNAAALAGGLYLLAARVVHWRLPVAVLIGIGLPAAVWHDGGSSASLGSPLFHWFAGATMLAAFFIATDPVTAPRAASHQWLFGLAIGAAVFAIRAAGAHPDGVAFAVLLGNLATPVLDRWRGAAAQGPP